MSRNVTQGSHRAKVLAELSESEWTNCYAVADELQWSVERASKFLSDLYAAGYTDRRLTKPTEGDSRRLVYEYQLIEGVEIA